jgi:hypothetical protein
MNEIWDIDVTLSRLAQRAIDAINRQGFLLVFPIQNQPHPNSLWAELYPKTKMRWEWDDSADNRVARLWRLREEIAKSKQIIYGKFYRGRATVFSKATFTNLLCVHGTADLVVKNPEARFILEALRLDSPLSTKQLKEVCGLQGRLLESAYSRALQELWKKFLIVGVGEIDDGAFPSLAHAATQTVFEDLWMHALNKDPGDAMQELLQLPEASLLLQTGLLP